MSIASARCSVHIGCRTQVYYSAGYWTDDDYDWNNCERSIKHMCTMMACDGGLGLGIIRGREFLPRCCGGPQVSDYITPIPIVQY